MSLEMQTFVPAVDDSIIHKWMKRMNGLGMRCEIHPDFSFASHTGFLPFRIALERSTHQELVGVDFLTGYEFYKSDFDLEKELEERKPKPSMLNKIARRKHEPIYFASPEVDPRLIPCKQVLSFVWGAADTFELRMATLSAAVLVEITNGVCAYPADNIWYSNSGIVENALKEAEAYEASLKPSQLKVHKFEKWL